MTDLQNPDYDPNGFVDWLREAYMAKNDAALSREIGCSPVVFSKIRHRKLAVPLSLIVIIHEHTAMKTLEIKARMFQQPIDLAKAA